MIEDLAECFGKICVAYYSPITLWFRSIELGADADPVFDNK
mgnify:CR=1 FL=1